MVDSGYSLPDNRLWSDEISGDIILYNTVEEIIMV